LPEFFLNDIVRGGSTGFQFWALSSGRDPFMSARESQRVINHHGRDIPLRTRRNRRARHMTLRIDVKDGCAVLTLPTFVTVSEGMGFAHSKADWLAQRLDELAPHIPFTDDSRIPYRGHDILIRHFPLAGPNPILIDNVLHVPGCARQVPDAVRKWLIEEARRAIAVRSAVKTAMIRRDPAPFRLNDPKSRWGSCSSEGKLCFSWRLIMAPIEVLDYVVAHEVAHLVALNHGPRFHAAVERLTPHADYARDWFNTEGARLLRYG
jgi:predicted metal-dependent hydrolase